MLTTVDSYEVHISHGSSRKKLCLGVKLLAQSIWSTTAKIKRSISRIMMHWKKIRYSITWSSKLFCMLDKRLGMIYILSLGYCFQRFISFCLWLCFYYNDYMLPSRKNYFVLLYEIVIDDLF